MTAKEIFGMRDVLAYNISKQAGMYNLRLSIVTPSIWNNVRVPISEVSAFIHVAEELKNVSEI